ncbi:MFS polyamine transporter [Gymnopus androsaceus JB14]|uniref:MFS polyamine transporter n=1 Tax=Gymnopus androsaceus JB14 TaxID=1447944 RepID=A0A6A4IM63_9AGAR|nr:MFS polyamine transporter [Gymnopus androsaceus JB14]
MPSEPIEAEFATPPALSQAQEEEFRQLELEGPLHVSRLPTSAENITSIQELERKLTRDGFHIVGFEKGQQEDPREWSRGRKWYITLTTAFLCLAVAMGSSIVTGDLQDPVVELSSTQEILNLTVTCFVIGFGLWLSTIPNSPLAFAPLSEVVGRTPMYQASIFLYFIFTLPSALAKNAATLVVARQIAGLAASAPMCNVGGSIADIWSVEERGVPMAIFSVTIFMGPCIGPLLGGWIGERAGWRWIYWVLFIFAGCCFLLTLFLPETLAPVILRKKAAKLRKETGDSKYMTLEEAEKRPLGEVFKTALLRPIVLLFTEVIVILFSFYLAFVYSLLYLLFFAMPIAFSEIRGYSSGITGVTFLSIMMGISLAMCLLPFQERTYRAYTQYGTYPEARLFGMMVGAIVLPIGLLIFAFTGAYAHVNFMGPCVAGAIFGFAMILIYVSANSYIVDSYSSFAASAIAAKTLLRSEVGAAVPLYVEQMFSHMGFQWAGLLLALVAIVIAPIPFVFYRYGERIRCSSKRATKSIRRKERVLEDVKS